MALPKPFRYAALLRVRKRQEDFKAQALAMANREARTAEHQRAEIVRLQWLMFDEAGQVARSSFSASDVRYYYQYERHLARLAVEKDADIRQLRCVEEQRRTELEDAMKRRRIVEKLQERRLRAFMFEYNKLEQKISDEIAVNRAAVKRDDRPSQ